MSERIGVCEGCSSQFKVPATFQGTQAKCKKCGGVVRIPAASGASDASTLGEPDDAGDAGAAPPSRARSRTSSSGRNAGKMGVRPRTRAGAPAAAAAPPAEESDSGTTTRRRHAHHPHTSSKALKQGNNTGLMVIGIIAVVGLVGLFFMMQDSGNKGEGTQTTQAPPPKPNPPPVAMTPEADPAAKADATPPVNPQVDRTEKAPADGTPPAPAPTSGDDPSAAPKKAPEPEKPPEEPLPPVVKFEPFGKPSQLTDEKWAELSARAKMAYDDNARPGERSKARDLILETEEDKLGSIPAVINQINGRDLSNQADFIHTYNICVDLQKISYDLLNIPFKGDILTKDQNLQKNAKVCKNLAEHWAKWHDKPAEYQKKMDVRKKEYEMTAPKTNDDDIFGDGNGKGGG